ncbi:MAG: EVE domain-containing protein [bacterium]|nr:EVE domain-containing protein [bacterium]
MAKRKRYWLMKTEPDVCSFDDIANLPNQTTGWDGVHNYQARNSMRDEMSVGDPIILYHSNAMPPHAIGIGEVASEAYPDPTQFDKKQEAYDPKATKEKPIWYQVDVKAIRKFSRAVGLPELRQVKALQNMVLFRASRLSVQPLTKREYEWVVKLGDTDTSQATKKGTNKKRA